MPVLRSALRATAASAVLAAAMTLAAPLGAQEAVSPVTPQPAADAVQPGLAVKYYFHLFRHIDELIDWQDYKDGKPGPVIERLNYAVGQGDVLTSGVDNGVGAEITGLIRLEKAGTYAFALNSNDGIRLWVGGAQIVDDPGVHADQFSPIGEVSVETPGWYPFKLLYFERKNTSTLQLHWRQPGDPPGTMPLVPAEVFGHIPAEG